MIFLDATSANIVMSAIRALSFFLCEIIYGFIVSMYNIFDRLCNSRILDSTALQTIAERVGILLGIIMLFMVVFSVIQMVLDPDKLTDKEKGIGNILKKVISVIVMLGLSTFAFDLMYGIQKKVIDSNIIQKFFLPYETTGKDDFGGVLSYNLFISFFQPNIDGDISNAEDIDQDLRYCYNDIFKLEENLKTGKKAPFSAVSGCATATDGLLDVGIGDKYIIDFNWFIAPIVGAGVLYFIFSYCISVGIRTIQLAFLEIMAPMAIISYLSPKKDNMFQKWTKLYFSTYIDVFLRIAIINLIIFLIMTLLESADKWVFWASVGGKTGKGDDNVIWILMIFALLTFAKKAPDLIKDLFPAGASKLGLGISSPKQLFDGMLGAKQAKSFVNNTVGLLGRKTIAGIDAKLNGQNFRDGWKTPKGKFGTWLGKQRETYLPNFNEIHKNKIEGAKEIEKINTKWNKGKALALKLREAGANAEGIAADRTSSDKTKWIEPGWDKVFDGTSENEKYYRAIFTDERFIKSKMNVDLHSSIEDDLRRLQQKVNLEGATKAFASFANGTKEIGGKKYDINNVADLIKDLENQQKKVEGLKNNHASISKQCHKDAEREEQFKYYKNNDFNPTKL